MLTERCNAHCRHCFVSDYTEQGRDMALADAQRYISEFAEVTGPNTPFTLHFSGGEVFLQYNRLIALTRYAKEKGAAGVVCVTNGAWGENPSLAHRYAGEMLSAGMSRVSFSIDDFHQECIPLDFVRNAISACLEAGLDIGVKCVVTRSSRRLHDVMAGLRDLLINVPLQAEEWAYVPPHNNERIPRHEWILLDHIPQEHCPEVTLTILPDGTVYPCCGAGWTSKLILGNAGEETLADLIKKAEFGHVFSILRDKGPAFFFPYFNRSEAIIPAGGYVSNCHLCMTMLEHPAFHEIFPNALMDWKKERINEALGGLWNPENTTGIPSKG